MYTQLKKCDNCIHVHIHTYPFVCIFTLFISNNNHLQNSNYNVYEMNMTSSPPLVLVTQKSTYYDCLCITMCWYRKEKKSKKKVGSPAITAVAKANKTTPQKKNMKLELIGEYFVLILLLCSFYLLYFFFLLLSSPSADIANFVDSTKKFALYLL